MAFAAPPAVAAWAHEDARSGFEVAGIQVGDGVVVTGCTTAVEHGEAWVVDYEIVVGADWCTRSARVTQRLGAAVRTVTVEGHGEGHWLVDGRERADLDGCLDVDLESSALTNAFPVHRLALATGRSAEAPAVYVRTSLAVERLEQTYTRLADAEPPPLPRTSSTKPAGFRGRTPGQRFRYRADAFDFECELVYDASGFALSYPGIATRAL